MTSARDWADRIAASAPLAVQTVKEVLRSIEGDTIERALSQTPWGPGDLPIYRKMLRSEDAKEGVRAFFEKRTQSLEENRSRGTMNSEGIQRIALIGGG
ncbi:MAG: hypothetical protein Ct9H300mP16_19010 [Pseudomonadota bacterium]|nr:MAG: hypothetical protein Ct9H300mP16_19010 [Pseudomonadota bacterium]